MREINIVYGSSHNKGVAFVCDNRSIYGTHRWYVIKGGTIVNKTIFEVEEGCDVEELEDFDCITSTKPINTLKQLEKFLES